MNRNLLILAALAGLLYLVTRPRARSVIATRGGAAIQAAAVKGAAIVTAAKDFLNPLRKLIAREEGIVPYVYQGAKDAPGVLTFGIGHKLTPGDEHLKQYTAANPAPLEVVHQYFDKDMGWAMREVDALRQDFTANQYAALVSLVFNIGAGNWQKSEVRRRVLAGDMRGAADSFRNWHKAGGKPGVLTARRERERELFLTA